MASSKRARAPSNSSHTGSCLVDGCGFDLSSCKDYHKRHKVCEIHAKSPRVMVAGQEQRFCQQCSRFHSLVEFDEVKRSCRKRLDGHNRRRRKSQLDSASAKPGILFSNQPGIGFSSYVTTTQMVTNPMSAPNWAAAVKSGEGLVYHHGPPLYFLDRQRLIPAAIAHDGKRGKWSPILHGTCNNDGHTLSNQKTGVSGCGPVPNIIDTSEGSDGKVSVGGLIQVAGSDCALSLLSMPTLASSNGLTEATNQTPIAHPLVPAGPLICKYSCSQASNSVSSTGFSCSELDDEQVGTILASNGSSPDLQSPEMLQMVHDGPLESEANQALRWYH